MIIYPEIDLQQGKCVNLVRGQMDQPVVFDIDPIEALQEFAHQGARRVHVVDLDRLNGKGDNADIIERMIKVGPDLQLGGGLRTMEALREWSDKGVSRLVLGTAAAMSPSFAKEAAYYFPDQIVISVDVRDGKVMTHGWTESTIFTPVDFINQFEGDALAGIVLTDVGREAEDPIEAFAMTTEVANAVRIPVISSGLVRSLDDISTLKYLPNIAGAITGRALFNKAFRLEEAIDIANEVAELAPFQ